MSACLLSPLALPSAALVTSAAFFCAAACRDAAFFSAAALIFSLAAVASATILSACPLTLSALACSFSSAQGNVACYPPSLLPRGRKEVPGSSDCHPYM